MATAEATYVPPILRQKAELDGVPIEILIRQATEAIETQAAEVSEPEEIYPADPTLPLFDRNGLYVRHVTEREAQRLVDRGAAVGQMACGWNSSMRSDLPWLSVRLVLTRGVLEYSNASLDHVDAENVDGLHGDGAAALASRQKLDCWPEVGDEKAPRVSYARK